MTCGVLGHLGMPQLRQVWLLALQNGNAAGKSWEGPAQWATLAAVGVPDPPDIPARWHNWGLPTSPRGWLQVQVTRELWLQVWCSAWLPSLHQGFVDLRPTKLLHTQDSEAICFSHSTRVHST
jgi:hypothetical protein